MNFEEALKSVNVIDNTIIEKSKEHWLDVAKPLFSLGKLEKIITQIAGIRGCDNFTIQKKAVIMMCADNGVVEENVTQSGQDITAFVSENFVSKKTSVCIMADVAGADTFPIDVGVSVDIKGLTDENKVAYGTKNITKEPAMTYEQMIKAIEIGINKVIELKEKGYDIIATGEMGIGNTTTSSAVSSILLGIAPEKITGRGAGLSSEGLERKINAVKKAIEVNKPDKNNALDVLMKVGGLDIAALTGVFIGGCVCKIPIVIDGFISAVAALLAVKICDNVKDFMIASHISKESGSRLVLEYLGFEPIIDADMCLGEGTGAVALFPLIDMAYNVYTKLYTFSNWSCGEAYKVQA